MSVTSVLMRMMADSPQLVSAGSRHNHAGVGDFDNDAGTLASPGTEPRQDGDTLIGTHLIVMTWDRAVSSGTASITEGTATVGTITFSGAEMRIPLSSVSDQQYVTVLASAVNGSGSASTRIGFLWGDVNKSRVVSTSDTLAINGQISQPVTGSNFNDDVNCSGAITLSDKSIANALLTHSLPAP